jgi:hypothetical protein
LPDWLGRVALLTAAIAIVSAVSAASIHSSCTEAFPFSAPESGTDRAGYCSAIHGGSPWLALVLVPCAVMFLGGTLARKHRRTCLALATAIMLAVMANALVAGNLDYALPGP